jgi:Ca2+-binding EF-hand superfamily protein
MSDRRPAGLAALFASAALAIGLSPAAADDRRRAEAGTPALDHKGVQDVMFLTDARPIFIRLRLDAGGKGFRAAWLDAVKAIHKYLDRDGDGTLTREEADRGSLPLVVRAATGGAAALPRADLDANPKDGKVSVEELADVLRPALGPFRVQVGRLAIDRNDALFNYLDRDRDGTLTKDELAAAVSSLHRFDLDDNELIDPNELEPFGNPIAALNQDLTRRGKYAPVPAVIELSCDDPSFRPVRLLLKKYDQGASEGSAAGDNRLSAGELGIDARDFVSADTDRDGELDSEELRRYLGRAGPDLELVVKLPGGESAATSIEAIVTDSQRLPPGVHVHRLSESEIEVALGEVNLEFHADGGEQAGDFARRYYASQFQAADKDNNKYLEMSEVKDHHGPFAALFDMIDRDGDGKIYMKEVDEFVDRQSSAARSQMVLSVADQGRAIFAVVDTNRDHHLSVREIRGAVARVLSWDRNGDGKIRSDEIPHHYELSIGRGQITAVGMSGSDPRVTASPPSTPAAAGPKWYRKMDRNRDGDISRREFLGPRAAFERLDADGDGLISAQEAATAKK